MGKWEQYWTSVSRLSKSLGGKKKEEKEVMYQNLFSDSKTSVRFKNCVQPYCEGGKQSKVSSLPYCIQKRAINLLTTLLEFKGVVRT